MNKIKMMSILLVTLLLGMHIGFKNIETKTNKVEYTLSNDYKEITISDKIDSYVDENDTLISFYTKMFGIEKEVLVNKLKSDFTESFEPLDLMNTGNCTTMDSSLLFYLIDLEKKDASLFKRTYSYEKKSKEYIYGLVEYFASIYGNVDVQTAKSIAYIESGNLNASSMMKKNNIFGGMGSHGLTSYPSIEYGVWKYIELLSTKYYGKGLTTVAAIGRVYNPVVVDGKKIANPTWVSNVNTYRNHFLSEITITSVEDLKNL